MCWMASSNELHPLRRCPQLLFKHSRPTRQEEHVGFGQCAFAVAPGNFFDSHNAAAATVDAPHGVRKEDENGRVSCNPRRLSAKPLAKASGDSAFSGPVWRPFRRVT